MINHENELALFLREAGRLLFGEQWINPMGLAMGISRNAFKRMLAARRPHENAAQIRADALKLCRDRAAALCALIGRPG